MQPAFDPYYRWLGIPPAEQPADYYRLLGVPQFEPDEEVISNAADARMGFVRTFQSGQHTAESQRILNELSVARVVLLNPSKRQQYDSQLRIAIQKNTPAAPAAAVPIAVPAAPAWAFHPPAPGYNGAAPMYPNAAYPQQAPYLQPVAYPQPAPWIGQHQPAQATFVGGALADADAARARAEAE